MGVQTRIKRIMAMKDSDGKEVALRELAQEYGCSLASTYTDMGVGIKHHEEEVIRRIQEADRSARDGKLWWIALISAIASVVSALAAWCAVLRSWVSGLMSNICVLIADCCVLSKPV